ncbi:hypothetical protein AAJ76_1110002494 [Vairimorpha ceranae]|uniref:Uncharacterized protein n=1 Tax=Vairimorpha ceranae TaxID=40302 RepID=A0A0F9WM40_9MICR|nr:hypothetical protein AAJ76_1110002494 [Vairimorpha ceranae]KAF5141538.1 hypothetical protein G9O61_00g002770 [Vairimorpha ceranae]KKO74138.1 hypothetical protein AAJ76_1110002494 [Vairimorpha ceranae]
MKNICKKERLCQVENYKKAYILYFYINNIIAIKTLDTDSVINCKLHEKIKKGNIVIKGSEELVFEYNVEIVEINEDKTCDYTLIIKRIS